MPQHALYYPDWDIGYPMFLAESLSYWDRLACIVPFSDFNQQPWQADEEIKKLMTEAHERYVFPLVPTDEQKERAHQRIETFALKPPPEWCRPTNLKPERRKILSAYKFSPDGTRFRRELRRCGFDTIASKEGAVAVLIGIAAGVLNPGLGLAFGLAGGLIRHRRKRREIFEKHWSSWVFYTPAHRFSIW